MTVSEMVLAAGFDRPVIAIKAEEVENIPIPYLKHYYSYSSTYPAPQFKEKI
jgi:hypothetical protein